MDKSAALIGRMGLLLMGWIMPARNLGVCAINGGAVLNVCSEEFDSPPFLLLSPLRFLLFQELAPHSSPTIRLIRMIKTNFVGPFFSLNFSLFWTNYF